MLMRYTASTYTVIYTNNHVNSHANNHANNYIIEFSTAKPLVKKLIGLIG